MIDDVLNNVRETFLDDGIDEQVLVELKQIWESKLMQSKAVPPENVPVESEQVVAATATAVTAPAQVTVTASAPVQPHAAVTIAQQAPTGSIVHPTLQYFATTAGQGGGDATKTVTFTLPQTVGSGQKPVTITLPAHLMQQAATTGIVMSSSAAAAAQALPAGMTAGLLQSPLSINAAGVITQQGPDGTTVSYQAVTAEQLSKQGYMVSLAQEAPQPTTTTAGQIHPVQAGGIIQLDGANDTSDDDDDDDDLRDDDNDPDDDEQNEDEAEGMGEEEEPLNSGDDVSDEDPSELFDTDNVIVCQYDKITRSRNKWKFHLKDGIMNVLGRDYVFQRASGDAEW